MIETLLVLALWTIVASLSPRMFIMVYLPGGCRAHVVPAAGLLRTRPRNDEPLWPDLQRAVLQRRLSRGAPRPAIDALVTTERATSGCRDREPLAARPAMAGVHGGFGRARRRSDRPTPAGSRQACELEGGGPTPRPPENRRGHRTQRSGADRARSGPLQRFVVSAHERAFKKLLVDIGDVRTVTIVGGGPVPAYGVRHEAPSARRHVDNRRRGRRASRRRRGPFSATSVALRREVFDPGRADAVDLLITPLAYVGDRRLLYDRPVARAVLVHDWIWSTRGRGVVVSWLLLKRLNLVLPSQSRAVDTMAS